MPAASARYANRTNVSAERSRASIERLLVRYGADRFAYGWESGRATLGFAVEGRFIRIVLSMPTEADVARTATGRSRAAAARRTALEQAERQHWRALELVLHAKLEAIAAGISTIEDEFLAWTVLPDGSTVGERVQPQIESAYRDGRMPALLEPPREGPRELPG